MRITASQAALKTRLKVQVIEQMERDDFSKMPAPTYARGFIRIYADFLGLDSAPLVQEYNEHHGGGKRPPLHDEPMSKVIEKSPPTPTMPEGKSQEELIQDTVLADRSMIQVFNFDRKKLLAGAIVVGAVLVVIAAEKLWPARAKEKHSSSKKVVEIQRQAVRVPEAITREPPEPYIDVGTQGKKP